MPTLDFIDIGDVVNSEFLRGTITSINSTVDTCTVDVMGATMDALIFYH